MHILDNVQVWNSFRKSLDVCSGLYRKRLAVMREFGVDQARSVRDKQKELELVAESLEILQTRALKILQIDGVAILARPKATFEGP